MTTCKFNTGYARLALQSGLTRQATLRALEKALQDFEGLELGPFVIRQAFSEHGVEVLYQGNREFLGSALGSALYWVFLADDEQTKLWNQALETL